VTALPGEEMALDRRVVIVGPPPTPNGDLHIGHIAGPYMAADVHARYLRTIGRRVLYVTGTDDNQTYVVSTAARRGTTPEALAERSTRDMQRSLEAIGVVLDGFAPFDEGYRAAVLDFTTRLHAAGKLRLRTVRLPYDERCGQFLVEGLVEGGCPVCLAVSRGGLCESCGHPNNFDELVHAHSTMHPSHPVTTREARILVLPLEEYRDRISAFYETKQSTWRPRIVQLVCELLARPLPDFAITYPVDWGFPAPFAETPGQVLNAWAEGMPASMYCTEFAQRRAGERPGSYDELWRAEHDIELVYFLGFDNAYFWGITHLSLLLAYDGEYVLPHSIVCNEFYELEHEKFSTSRGHVIWTRDLLQEVPRDLVRFYLALTAPEHSRTNFSRAALDTIAQTRLVEPWNVLAAACDDAVAALGVGPAPLPVTAAARERSAAMAERFAACYELSCYSLTRAADLIVLHTARLGQEAAALASGPAGLEARCRLGDLLGEVRTLIVAASPILIDLASAAAEAGGLDACLNDGVSRQSVRPFAVPRLADAPPVGGLR
jgi:methionyl-tRNA synthetase